MKVAVIGSRGLNIDVSRFIPEGTTQIISGGARGIDSQAEAYAKRHGLPLCVFRPDYQTHGRQAPLLRNFDIIDAADYIVAIWDGKSRGTLHALNYAKRKKKPVRIYRLQRVQPRTP
jgi:hypothetical protein